MLPAPIDPILPRVRDAVRSSPAVLLSAPPGAGKTTRVPLALLEAFPRQDLRIIMLEPRRLAARRAAAYMAELIGERVGRTVGFRIRGESQVSAATRIEVVTEGILTRFLQEDPSLPGIGAVIFDEFHERSIHADLGLALTLDAQEHLRPDLRVLVMSATLDGLRLSGILPDAPLIESPGRSYPVETRYIRPRPQEPVERGILFPILSALREQEGDLLVFLPGRREIRRVAALLDEQRLPPEVKVHQLFGDAPLQQQNAALNPPLPGERKIILATSVAETSITVDGVTAVVDSGLSRVPRFDPRRGMAGLTTVPVSQAGADQRRGRAGRTAPGICYRLWSELDHAALPPFQQPEILASDLAPLALELARWGDPEGTSLRFIDPPPPSHLAQARHLLMQLGAIDSAGKVTEHGRALARFPVHPRFAHMILRGAALGCGGIACDCAALLEEREILLGESRSVDLRVRWDALVTGRGADPATRERIRREADRLRGLLPGSHGDGDDGRIGLLLAFAYPERIARRRDGPAPRYQMASGTGATIPADSPLARAPFLAIGETDGTGNEVRAYLAAPLTLKEIEEGFSERITATEEIRWSEDRESVIARRIRSIDALVLSEGSGRAEGPNAVAAMIAGIRSIGISSLPWGKEEEAFRGRSEWLRSSGASDPWPDLRDETLLARLEGWLAPYLEHCRQRRDLDRIPLLAALASLFTPEQRRALDRLAPSHLLLPSGSRVPLQYEAGGTPVLAVRLQELFGQTDSPAIGGGRIPVVIHLLSPARRPLAVTQDLRSFWTTAYPALRTQMRARYPRHFWPEDPLSARPTNRTVKRKK